MLKNSVFGLIVFAVFASSVSAQTVGKEPALPQDKSAWQDQPMKICVVSKTAEQEAVAEAVAEKLVVKDNIKIKTVLPEKTAELRTDMTKAKELGYTHVLIVSVTHSASITSVAPDTKLYKAMLSLQLYEVSSETVIKRWTHRGLAVKDSGVSNTDPDAQSQAVSDAAENAAKIFEKPKVEAKDPTKNEAGEKKEKK